MCIENLVIFRNFKHSIFYSFSAKYESLTYALAICPYESLISSVICNDDGLNFFAVIQPKRQYCFMYKCAENDDNNNNDGNK